MADPLLTSLCAICHVSTPKYKCPRCNMQTCSLACTKKHKLWSDCTGQRDPTAYLPRSKLRTPAGVDHDYNFLHGIELSLERTEKVLVEDKKLVQQEELRPMTVQQVRWKTGRDGRKRKVLVTQTLREAKGRVFERGLAQKLKKLNVQIICAPLGMSRQRENNTTLNRRTGRVNWQVEWLSFEDAMSGKESTQRWLSKVMDDLPLYQAYPIMLEEKARTREDTSRKLVRQTRPGEVQSSMESTWNFGLDCIQDPADGTWASFSGGHIGDWPAEKDQRQRQQFQFFLAGRQARSDLLTLVTALESADCLRDVLSNTRVLEFPTIYVLEAGQALPPGFVLGPKDIVPPPQQEQQRGMKRKDGSGTADRKMQEPAKRRKQGGVDLEDGEVGSGVDNDDEEPKGVGMEVGEIIAEQSFGEDEDEDEDDATSSSGSDSESE